MNLRRPFRGTQAVAAGVLTPKMLRGPRFRRLFQDVYVAADVEVDPALRSCAAYLLVQGAGVVGGYSAAELLGASCGPANAPAEIVSPTRMRSRPGLLVREGVVPPDERWRVGEVLVISPLHTAFRLACRLPLVEAVVAVDALAHRFRLDPWAVVRFGYGHPGAAGSGQLPEVARLADPLSESRWRRGSAWRSAPAASRCRCSSTPWARTTSTWPTPTCCSPSSTTVAST